MLIEILSSIKLIFQYRYKLPDNCEQTNDRLCSIHHKEEIEKYSFECQQQRIAESTKRNYLGVVSERKIYFEEVKNKFSENGLMNKSFWLTK